MSSHTVNASIITIGDELLIGQTIDTNSAFIAQELNKIGIWVHRRLAVGDVYEDIRKALDEEGKQSGIIIITGGLGPTADDITKPLLCDYFGGKMVINEQVLAHIKYLFEKVYNRTGPMLESNLKQAEVPDTCEVLHNARGTAPGMWFKKQNTQTTLPSMGIEGSSVYISLPGVPHEMKGLMTDQVIPRLLKAFSLPAIVHRTAFTAGQGESLLAEILKPFETSLPRQIKLAYLPNYGMVKLRLTARGNNREELEKEATPYFEQLQLLVKDYLVSDEDEGLETVIGKLLKEKGLTMGTAESCTGGYIAHLITSIPGSSAYYKGSIISYANEIKTGILGVQPSTLASVGAVSEETVTEMVKGAIETLQVDIAVATSGIMGPDGGTPEKPVGTVWIAAGNKDKTATLQLKLRFDRQRNIDLAAVNALNFLRKFILANS
ncbi:MAG: CinA family nicotinamide mononucleotide deamidase-related protein [Sphingobacteriales bacterium]|nr:CinA family nicotinamide mononucleotide deamidase-related protein [Sphingobacteriales bacterium]